MFIKVLICAILFATTFVKADTDNVISACVFNDISPKHKLNIELELEGYDLSAIEMI